MTWNEFILDMLLVTLIIAALLFVSGCSILHDSDERNLEVDCSNCKVKYRMNLDIDNAHIKEHIQ